MVGFGIALRDGALLAVGASAVVMGSLRLNPRLFMRHFPEAVRQRLAPLSPGELRAGRIVGALLMALLLGGPLASVLVAGPQPPASTFLHAFTVGMVFNVVDWLLLDELWLGLLKPRWALPPGTVIADFEPFDHARHFRGFVTGAALCAIVAALATGIAAVLA